MKISNLKSQKHQSDIIYQCRRNLYVYLLFAAVLVFFLTAGPIRAQSLSLSISPPLLEVLIKPGKTITQVYKIRNNGESAVITPRLQEYTSEGVKYDPEFAADSWITLQNQDIAFNKPFLLNPNEERQIILKINPPKNTAEKDYYRVLIFSTTPNPALANTQASVSQSLGSILIVNVTTSGLTQKGAQITSFDLPLIIDSFSPLRADIFLQNTGKTYLRPVGEIKLTGPIAHGAYKINPKVFLAGEKKLLTLESSSNPPDSTLLLPGFYLGKYQLALNLTLDEGSSIISQEKIFYAFPWKLTLIIFLIISVKLIWRKRKK